MRPDSPKMSIAKKKKNRSRIPGGKAKNLVAMMMMVTQV